MNTIPLKKSISIPKNHCQEIADFYNATIEDYHYWSKNYNMHFGYFAGSLLNIFKRDVMLNQMNKQVLKRLQIPKKKASIIDLGCGMGSTLKYALENHKNLTGFGVTLSDFQCHFGNERLKNLQACILKENYNATSFQNQTFDRAIAIESLCHDGHSTSSFKEAYRILKPNGKLVVADAFLKTSVHKLKGTSKTTYKNLCTHFSLTKLATIKEVETILQQIGFQKVAIEEVSFRVAPSVFHVPFAIVGFTMQQLLKGKKLEKKNMHNLLGSFYALLSGMHLHRFGYYYITASK